MTVCFLEAGLSVVTSKTMGPAVFAAPPVSLLVTRGVGFIGALACLF